MRCRVRKIDKAVVLIDEKMAFFELDKATIQSDQGSSITVPIESDNRFYFICFESQLSEEKKRLNYLTPEILS